MIEVGVISKCYTVLKGGCKNNMNVIVGNNENRIIEENRINIQCGVRNIFIFYYRGKYDIMEVGVKS